MNKEPVPDISSIPNQSKFDKSDIQKMILNDNNKKYYIEADEDDIANLLNKPKSNENLEKKLKKLVKKPKKKKRIIIKTPSKKKRKIHYTVKKKTPSKRKRSPSKRKTKTRKTPSRSKNSNCF